ncbi:uncharacterized protein LOC127725958, partial [Mytilus californianus]|uniref:uncharacterized protein LOC127725958 n=1 Tax=Mytilus californianus TaxID=6549 RepID=UPI0022453C97
YTVYIYSICSYLPSVVTIQSLYTVCVYTYRRWLPYNTVLLYKVYIQYVSKPTVGGYHTCLNLPSVVTIQYSTPLHSLYTVFVHTYRRWLPYNTVLLYTVYIYSICPYLQSVVSIQYSTPLHSLYIQYLSIPTVGSYHTIQYSFTQSIYTVFVHTYRR